MALWIRQEGLEAVDGRSIDALARNALKLKHLVKTRFTGRVQVLSEIFKA